MANLRVNKITGTEVFETTGSVQFDGITDYMDVAASSDFAFATGDFTVEVWIYTSTNSLDTYYRRIYMTDGPTGNATGNFQISIEPTTGKINLWENTGALDVYSTSNVSNGVWNHIAACRSGTTLRLFVNGILENTTTYSTSVTANSGSPRPRIGNYDGATGSGDFNGHISNLRILKGTALYTKNFTPPTRELTVIPNTVLLCCQSTTRANEERTGKTITVNGNAVANELTPGLLTNVVKSGGSSAISGSVEFDGSDYLLESTGAGGFNASQEDWTIESWMYCNDASQPDVLINAQTASTDRFYIQFIGQTIYIGDGTSNIIAIGGVKQVNSWFHIAVTKSSSTYRAFINGILIGSSTSGLLNYNLDSLTIGYRGSQVYYTKGFISNLRIVKGTALYTSNFIPPTRELKKIPGTVLLCCKDSTNPIAEETGKTISLNGSVTSYSVGIGTTTPNPRNFAPQVGSDGSVIFDGVTKINSPNYFYLPTGNTEDRGRGRGVFGGGYVPGTSQNTIQFINIQSQGNAQDFGDLSSNMGSADGKAPCAAASTTRALFASGYSAPGPVNTIEYVTIATTSNSTDFGDLITSRRDLGACASSTRAVFGGGTTTGSTSTTNVIEYVTIASTGNAISFGTLTQARRGVGSCSSPTRGIWGGGYVSNSPTTHSNRIDYVTIATTGSAITFGDLTVVRGSTTSCSSSIRGLFAGGSIYVAPASTFYNTIDYITISSTGNAQDFGDLSSTRSIFGSCSNSTRGVFGGGGNPTQINTMEFVLIASTGNATDFGDLLSVALYYNGGCSDSHGGLG